MVHLSPDCRPRVECDGEASAIGSKREARKPRPRSWVLRLIECTRLLIEASEKPIKHILGSPDDIKFRSSMTLFDAVSKQEIFAEALGIFYSEGKDPATLEILRTIKEK